MRIETWLKVGQLLGFALLVYSVWIFVKMGNRTDLDQSALMAIFFTLGAALIAGCRLTIWLRDK